MVYDIIEWIFSSRAKEHVTLMEDWLTMDMPENGSQISDDLNRVELSGTIVEIFEKDYVTRVTLGINTSYRDKLYSDYPYIYFPKKHNVSLDGFKLHDRVDILAAAITKKITREDGTRCKRQELCGVEIRKAGKMYEPRKTYFRNAEKKYYFMGLNAIHLEGILTGTFKVMDGVYGYAVRNIRNDKANQLHLRQFVDSWPDIPNGTRVAIEAMIHTRMRESDGYNHHFQDLIVRSVRVLD